MLVDHLATKYKIWMHYWTCVHYALMHFDQDSLHTLMTTTIILGIIMKYYAKSIWVTRNLSQQLKKIYDFQSSFSTIMDWYTTQNENVICHYIGWHTSHRCLMEGELWEWSRLDRHKFHIHSLRTMENSSWITIYPSENNLVCLVVDSCP